MEEQHDKEYGKRDMSERKNARATDKGMDGKGKTDEQRRVVGERESPQQMGVSGERSATTRLALVESERDRVSRQGDIVHAPCLSSALETICGQPESSTPPLS